MFRPGIDSNISPHDTMATSVNRIPAHSLVRNDYTKAETDTRHEKTFRTS